MKINCLLLFLFLAVSCNSGADPDGTPPEATTTEATTESSAPAPAASSADYSSLFNSPDCKVITAEEISAALGVSFVDMALEGRCSFQAKMPGNKTWYLGIMRNEMSSSEIQQEIENFETDETGFLKLQMNDTGDTYLGDQHSNGYLSLYNPNYNASILIRYGSVGESRAFSKEERLEHQALALKLANTLLDKHRR